MTSLPHSIRIRELNDAFRAAGPAGGDWLITPGVAGLGKASRAIDAVRLFSDFEPGNDPYGEHDFGGFTIDGEILFWKIDYYEASLTNGSEDPADAALTRRVMTIMLANEY